ncbi:MAG: M42 family metallopeptidase [Kiritimatiellae bacterium]|nr:M42 family metallopeptidase [Kiritimatiellia bacterium]
MDAKALGFLKELVSKPTPSGYEEPGQRVVAEYMRQFVDEVRTDVHGNVHGVLNPKGAYRVMLAGHCDEIGLMIMHIDDKGFLYFSSVGGVNLNLLQGERVVVHTAKGDIPGVIGVKPIHLMDPKEREGKPLKVHELWIDIGARSKKEAAQLVELGDVATIATGWIELRNNRVACRGFDDRIGAFVVADVLRLLRGKKLNVAVHAVSTVQEEIGLRGAITAAFGIEPRVGIAVDVTFATDQPDVEAKRVGEATLGGGPVLHRGPNFNPAVVAGLKAAAKALRLKTQMQPYSRGSGTDANVIQISRAGVATGLVSVPTRYIHSPVEVVNLRDVEDTVRLIARFIESLRGDEEFIP